MTVNPAVYELLNDYFTTEEIICCIKNLKMGCSPGIDRIPAEFIITCQEQLVSNITMLFNYIIEQKEFPAMWVEGLKTPVPKPGNHDNAANYGGITLLPIMAKLFEIAVNKRITFANEAFCHVDRNNGGFIKGSQTSDNIFILQGLIQKQITLGKSLYVCFVDFSKAFDIMNRHILFYKMITSGMHGRVIDTLMDMLRKTKCRIKTHGGLSPFIKYNCGVNQGGNLSPLLFRKYLADMSNYFEEPN